MNEQFQIKDRSSLHKYRTELPNILFSMDLDPYEFRVYSELKRIAGDGGSCFASNKELAFRCNMSDDKVTKCKRILEEPRAILNGKPLIEITKREGYTDIISINCIWEENFQILSRGTVANGTPHPLQTAPPAAVNGTPCRCQRHKEEPYKEEPSKKKEINKEKEEGAREQPTKKSFGKYEYVKMLDVEYAHLCNEYSNEEVDQAIEELDRWFAENPDRLAFKRNHHVTVSNWILRNKSKNLQKSVDPQISQNKETTLKIQQALGNEAGRLFIHKEGFVECKTFNGNKEMLSMDVNPEEFEKKLCKLAGVRIKNV
jgi:hypothetical protein